MGWNTDAAGDEGNRFFGQVSASISHEIKNVMAIINENAGLLKDYVLMQEKGIPIDPQRLAAVADKIVAQIRRADEIVGLMNTFSHSVDHETTQVNLGEMLNLMAALSARRAALRGVTFTVDPSKAPVTIVTSPFRLEYLLWRILDVAEPAVQADRTIRICADQTATGAVIRFFPLDIARAKAAGVLSSQEQETLLQSLGAELSGDNGKCEIVVSLTENRDQSPPARNGN